MSAAAPPRVEREHLGRGALVLAAVGLRGRRRGGMAATAVVLLLASIAMSAGLVVSRQGATLLDSAAAEARVAHLVLYGRAAAITEVAADPEVRAWEGPFATIDDLELVVDGEAVPMQLTALDDPDIAVHRPLPRGGRWARTIDEIVLDRSLAFDLGIGIGDAVSFRRNGALTGFTVAGLAVSFTDCLYPQCEPGRAWVTGAGLDRFAAGDDVFAQGWLRFDDAAQADPFVQRIAASGVTGIGGTESWLDTREDFLTLDRVFGAFVAAFGVFVLVVSAVVVAGSTAMRVVARRREIGLLGALGCTPRQVTAGLLVENVVVGAGVAVVGWVVAGFLAPSLQIGIGRTLGPQDPAFSAFALAVTLTVVVALLVVATIVPAMSAARRPVTDVLRDVPRQRVGALVRPLRGVPSRLSLLGVAEAAANPVRSSLAALAIVVAIVGSVVSVGFIGAVDEVGSDPARAGDPWDVAVLPGAVPAAQVEAVLDGSEVVDGWFGEAPRRSTFRDGAFLSVAMSGPPEAAAYVIAEGASLRAPGEAIAGYGFLQRFDVAVGDRIGFRAGTTAIDVRIVGMYRETEDSGEVLRYRIETLAAAEPGVVPELYRTVVADGVEPAVAAAALGAQLGPSVRTEILDTGVQDMGPLLWVLRLIALVLVGVAGTNLLSTLLTASREAAPRIGVQLAVGFTPRQVVAQGAATGAALGVLAAALGVPLGLWTFRALADVVSSSIGTGPGWMPRPPVATVVAIAALLVGLSALLGGLAVRSLARRSASVLVRGE